MVDITRIRRLLPALVAALALTIVSAPAANAASGNPGVVPPGARVFGKSYGAWSAAWWQYALAQPTTTNPLIDPTGALCNVGQSGSVFFLVGAFGGEKVVRNDCTVPAGKALFFPLVNVFDANNPGENRTARELWREMEAGLSFANLHASVDGIPVGKLRRYRACAGPVHRCAHPFSITLPDDNIFNAPAGIYTPAVADGIYLLLKPLAPGRHTITFGGTGRSDITGPFSADITYHLTVRPGHHHVHDRYASSSDK